MRYHLLSQLVNVSQVEFTAHSQAALQVASCGLAHAVQTSNALLMCWKLFKPVHDPRIALRVNPRTACYQLKLGCRLVWIC